MNYRHLYHAGNFADVAKHVVLVELIKALQRKDKPFCYIDTHAGIGRYNLTSTEAQKTREYENGIEKVLAASDAPEELQKYLEIVEKVDLKNLDSRLRGNGVCLQHYPGSPCIARTLLRPHDRMILNELHPDDIKILKQEFKGDQQVAIHERDAYEFLNAILPPQEKRGLILIDPAYEKIDETEQLLTALQKALQRFSNGVYAIWLPIKDISYSNFYTQLKNQCSAEILIVELTLSEIPEQGFGLMGCAMIIINPPYQIAEILQPQLEWLWKVWTDGKRGQVNIFSM